MSVNWKGSGIALLLGLVIGGIFLGIISLTSPKLSYIETNTHYLQIFNSEGEIVSVLYSPTRIIVIRDLESNKTLGMRYLDAPTKTWKKITIKEDEQWVLSENMLTEGAARSYLEVHK